MGRGCYVRFLDAVQPGPHDAAPVADQRSSQPAAPQLCVRGCGRWTVRQRARAVLAGAHCCISPSGSACRQHLKMCTWSAAAPAQQGVPVRHAERCRQGPACRIPDGLLQRCRGRPPGPHHGAGHARERCAPPQPRRGAAPAWRRCSAACGRRAGNPNPDPCRLRAALPQAARARPCTPGRWR